MFSRLLPILSDVPNEHFEPAGPALLVQRELLRALQHAELLSGSGSNVDQVIARWSSIFPGRYDSSAQAQQRDALENTAFDSSMQIMESAMQTGATARTRQNDQPYDRTRFRDLPDAPLTPAQVSDAKRQSLAALGEVDMWSDLKGALSESEIEMMKQGAQDSMLQMIDSFASLGPRRALAKWLGVEPDNGSDRKHTDTMVQEFVFRDSMRVLFREFVTVDAPTAEYLVNNISVAACPGTWMRNAVEIEMRKGRAGAEAGDEFDLDHIAFLPYVDLLTADRRTSQFSEQVLSRADLPVSVASTKPAARAGSLQELLALLEPFLAAA